MDQDTVAQVDALLAFIDATIDSDGTDPGTPSYDTDLLALIADPINDVDTLHGTVDSVSSPTNFISPSKKSNSNVRKQPAKKRARRQREELLYLRNKVQELQTQLETLQDKPALGVQLLPSTPIDHTMWSQMAMNQYTERLQAEEQNAQLRASLSDQLKLAASLADLLKSSNSLHDLPPPDPEAKRTKRSHESMPPHTSRSSFTEEEIAIFEERILETERAYGNVGMLMEQLGLNRHSAETPYHDIRVSSAGCISARIEILDTRQLPFDWQVVASTLWTSFIHRRYSENCIHYRVYCESSDMLVGEHGVNVARRGKKIHSRNRRVMRLFKEADRIVIVWRNDARPAKVRDFTVRGMSMQETGYIVVARGNSPKSARIQTYANVRPQLDTDSQGVNCDVGVGELTDLILEMHVDHVCGYRLPSFQQQLAVQDTM